MERIKPKPPAGGLAQDGNLATDEGKPKEEIMKKKIAKQDIINIAFAVAGVLEMIGAYAILLHIGGAF